jgi:Flp pilus assembly CpaE family ATPase
MKQPLSYLPDNSGEISNLVHRVHVMLANQAARAVTFIAARSGEGTSTIARQFAEGLALETRQRRKPFQH